MSAERVSGHLKIVQRTSGPVYYVKSRVPRRTPEQTTRRLGPVWKGDGRPPKDHYTRRMAEDAFDAYKEALILEGRLSPRTVVRHLTGAARHLQAR